MSFLCADQLVAHLLLFYACKRVSGQRGFQVIKRSLCLLALWLMVAMAGALTATQLIKSIWLHMTVLLSPSSMPPSVYHPPPFLSFFPLFKPSVFPFTPSRTICLYLPVILQNLSSVTMNHYLCLFPPYIPVSPIPLLSCLWWPAVLHMCPTPPAAGIVIRRKRRGKESQKMTC